jgi:hypothetical protein
MTTLNSASYTALEWALEDLEAANEKLYPVREHVFVEQCRNELMILREKIEKVLEQHEGLF